jgi:nicotinamide mononucleotide transporter
MMIDWIYDNWIEIAGAIFTLVFLGLEILRKWTMWIVGIISAFFYIYINFEAKLYAMMGLMAYNALISFYGLYCWKFLQTEDKSDLKFQFINRKSTGLFTLMGLVIFAMIAFVVIRFTDIENPLSSVGGFYAFFLDTLIATLSIVASLMAARKIVESWYLWLIVNPCTILLYVYKGMYPSTILYIVYAVFSVVGYVQWRKIAIQQK